MRRPVALGDNEGRLNLVVVGVGGQGVLTLANVIAQAAVKSGVKVLVAETHGMSQRGGSVIVHVRLGDVYSPLVPRGGADALVSLELIEASRYLTYVRRGGLVVAGSRVLRPPLPGVRPPSKDELVAYIKSSGVKFCEVDSVRLAKGAGSARSENMVLLGAVLATGVLNGYVRLDDVVEVVRRMRSPDVNVRALLLGYKAVKGRSGAP